MIVRAEGRRVRLDPCFEESPGVDAAAEVGKRRSGVAGIGQRNARFPVRSASTRKGVASGNARVSRRRSGIHRDGRTVIEDTELVSRSEVRSDRVGCTAVERSVDIEQNRNRSSQSSGVSLEGHRPRPTGGERRKRIDLAHILGEADHSRPVHGKPTIGGIGIDRAAKAHVVSGQGNVATKRERTIERDITGATSVDVLIQDDALGGREKATVQRKGCVHVDLVGFGITVDRDRCRVVRRERIDIDGVVASARIDRERIGRVVESGRFSCHIGIDRGLTSACIGHGDRLGSVAEIEDDIGRGYGRGDRLEARVVDDRRRRPALEGDPAIVLVVETVGSRVGGSSRDDDGISSRRSRPALAFAVEIDREPGGDRARVDRERVVLRSRIDRESPGIAGFRVVDDLPVDRHDSPPATGGDLDVVDLVQIGRIRRNNRRRARSVGHRDVDRGGVGRAVLVGHGHDEIEERVRLEIDGRVVVYGDDTRVCIDLECVSGIATGDRVGEVRVGVHIRSDNGMHDGIGKRVLGDRECRILRHRIVVLPGHGDGHGRFLLGLRAGFGAAVGGNGNGRGRDIAQHEGIECDPVLPRADMDGVESGRKVEEREFATGGRSHFRTRVAVPVEVRAGDAHVVPIRFAAGSAVPVPLDGDIDGIAASIEGSSAEKQLVDARSSHLDMEGKRGRPGGVTKTRGLDPAGQIRHLHERAGPRSGESIGIGSRFLDLGPTVGTAGVIHRLADESPVDFLVDDRAVRIGDPVGDGIGCHLADGEMLELPVRIVADRSVRIDGHESSLVGEDLGSDIGRIPVDFAHREYRAGIAIDVVGEHVPDHTIGPVFAGAEIIRHRHRGAVHVVRLDHGLVIRPVDDRPDQRSSIVRKRLETGMGSADVAALDRSRGCPDDVVSRKDESAPDVVVDILDNGSRIDVAKVVVDDAVLERDRLAAVVDPEARTRVGAIASSPVGGDDRVADRDVRLPPAEGPEPAADAAVHVGIRIRIPSGQVAGYGHSGRVDGRSGFLVVESGPVSVGSVPGDQSVVQNRVAVSAVPETAAAPLALAGALIGRIA